jgi:effector-binding domain-containing protein
MEHLRLNRPHEIEDEVRFRKPFKSKSKVGFRIEPVGEGTRLTWTMDGSLPWFMFWMKSSMETYVGQDYEHGLRKLRDRIEKGSVLSRVEVKGVESMPAMTVAGVRDHCSLDDIGPSMSKTFAKAKSTLAAGDMPTDGEMICVYHCADLKQRQFDYTGGYTVPPSSDASLNGLTRYNLPAGPALHVRHIGSYHHLGNAWSGAYAIARHQKLKLAKRESFEVYRNDPAKTPESEWITDIYIPVR